MLETDQVGSWPQIESLGLCHYKDAWDLQKRLHRDLIDGKGQETIITCEHFPVITFGKSSKIENLLVSESMLKEKGVELFQIERGGDITYHEPGQLVVYPILDLNRRKRDVSWYMRLLESIIIDSLAQIGLNTIQLPGKTGVWINEKKKIASIGVRLSRWCSMHGLAANICNTLEGFSLINPCGFTDIQMTSASKELSRSVDVSTVETSLIKNRLWLPTH